MKNKGLAKLELAKNIAAIGIGKEEPKQEILEEAKQRAANYMSLKGALEPKQETLEEAAKKEFPLIDTEWCRTGACEEENLHLLGHRKSFIKGAKWQQEQDKNKYNEEEVESLLHKFMQSQHPDWHGYSTTKWFKQYKKKK